MTEPTQSWRAEPLVWGAGPRVFELFLEPTCPFSVKAFGKLDETLAQGERVTTGKHDRLVRPVDIVSARQNYAVTQPMRVGDKEIVKARPYTLLSTTLTTAPTQLAVVDMDDETAMRPFQRGSSKSSSTC